MGALMYRVRCWSGMKLKEISKGHVSYVTKKCGNAYIVFDGCDEAILTKPNAHATRSISKNLSPNVIVQEENEAPYSSKHFLSNNHTKSQLISLLSEYLTSDGQIISRVDEDTKIVSTALELSKGSNVIVVVNDTDVVVMLLYHYQNQISDIYFLQGRGKNFGILEKFSKNIRGTLKALQRTFAFYTSMVKMRHYVINIWKMESNFRENGTEIRECAVCFRSYMQLLGNQGRSLLRYMMVQSLLKKLRQALFFHFSKFLLIEC